MTTIVCAQCGKEFTVSGWKARKGQRYCSRDCVNKARRGKVPPGLRAKQMTTMTCLQCGQEFQVYKNWVRRGRRKFCSLECRNKHQSTLTGEASPHYAQAHSEETKAKIAASRRAKDYTGPRAGSWRGGKCQVDGYALIKPTFLSPEHQALVAPMVQKNGYVLEHRVMMAITLGRPLQPFEVVHHRNGNKTDNRPENLILRDRAKHSWEHREIEKRLAALEEENQRLRSLLAIYQTTFGPISSIPESV